MSDELKKCPFCGGNASLTRSTLGMFTVDCCNEGCLVGPLVYDKDEIAIAAWNRRAAPGATVSDEFVLVPREMLFDWRQRVATWHDDKSIYDVIYRDIKDLLAAHPNGLPEFAAPPGAQPSITNPKENSNSLVVGQPSNALSGKLRAEAICFEKFFAPPKDWEVWQFSVIKLMREAADALGAMKP